MLDDTSSYLLRSLEPRAANPGGAVESSHGVARPNRPPYPCHPPFDLLGYGGGRHKRGAAFAGLIAPCPSAPAEDRTSQIARGGLRQIARPQELVVSHKPKLLDDAPLAASTRLDIGGAGNP